MDDHFNIKYMPRYYTRGEGLPISELSLEEYLIWELYKTMILSQECVLENEEAVIYDEAKVYAGYFIKRIDEDKLKKHEMDFPNNSA